MVTGAPYVRSMPSTAPVAVAAPAPVRSANSTTLAHPSEGMVLVGGQDFHEKAVNSNGGDGIRLVSLGCYCGPKLSFRALERDAETLPFDWCRTRIDGLLHFLQNDFDKFFHYDTREVVPGAGAAGKPMA